MRTIGYYAARKSGVFLKVRLHVTARIVAEPNPPHKTCPFMGCILCCFDRELALIPPLLGSSQRLLLRDHTETYFAGMPLSQCSRQVPLRRHGDEVQALPGGYYRALGRCDDTMNLGGIKVRSKGRHAVVLASRLIAARLTGAGRVGRVSRWLL